VHFQIDQVAASKAAQEPSLLNTATVGNRDRWTSIPHRGCGIPFVVARWSWKPQVSASRLVDSGDQRQLTTTW